MVRAIHAMVDKRKYCASVKEVLDTLSIVPLTAIESQHWTGPVEQVEPCPPPGAAKAVATTAKIAANLNNILKGVREGERVNSKD